MRSAPSPMFRDFSLVDFAEQHLAKSEHILFFYLWPHTAISLGSRQRQSLKLKEESLAAGIPLCIRPSGGRAVIHGSDICFTFISSQFHRDFGGDLKDSYSKVSNYVLKIINQHLTENLHLNLRITLNEDDEDTETLSAQHSVRKISRDLRKLDPSANCFDYLVNGEGCIYQGSKKNKVFGSAQMLHKNFFIQQGSLLVNKQKNFPQLSFNTDSFSLSDIIHGEELDLEEFCNQLNLLRACH